MVDVLTPEQRRLNMSRIRGKDTKPEMIVRRLLHSMGFRYRLHRRELPGCPDLVFPARKKAIFVHGCYWHMHSCRYGQVAPATNAEFWAAKRKANVARDQRNQVKLADAGWTSITVWECETKDVAKIGVRLRKFLQR
jgi:DNA mismatch endonuclease, patch repair protein